MVQEITTFGNIPVSRFKRRRDGGTRDDEF
jgi:hypothetical protein